MRQSPAHVLAAYQTKDSSGISKRSGNAEAVPESPRTSGILNSEAEFTFRICNIIANSMSCDQMVHV